MPPPSITHLPIPGRPTSPPLPSRPSHRRPVPYLQTSPPLRPTTPIYPRCRPCSHLHHPLLSPHIFIHGITEWVSPSPSPLLHPKDLLGFLRASTLRCASKMRPSRPSQKKLQLTKLFRPGPCSLLLYLSLHLCNFATTLSFEIQIPEAHLLLHLTYSTRQQ